MINSMRRQITASAVLLAMFASGCSGWSSGGGGTNTPPTTADAIVTYRWNTPPGANCKNETNVGWKAEPVSLKGGVGSTTTQAKTEGPAGTFPPSGDTCTLQEHFSGLQPGTWTFSVSIGASRTIDISAGSNPVDLAS
jgi:hypothetical protein